MSDSTELDRARRGLTAVLLGSPWAGALHAATQGANKAADKAIQAADTNPEAAITGRWTHGFAAYGQPKYGPDFKHFDYANPDAPKGGTIKLRNPDRRSSFDKFNPWTTRGSAPAGVLIWMVDTLMHMAQDEPMTMYGLLAEAAFVAPDFSSVSFRLNPKARFHNGDPVTPADVVHSLKMLKSKGASPAVQTGLAGVGAATVVDAQTVRIELLEHTREQVFLAGNMPVFSRKWGEGKTFDQVITEIPIVSGPYRIGAMEMPRRIEFQRDTAYWGADLPSRRGHFNFDRVVYRMYTDDAVAREAFKAGEFELFKEYRARSWVLQHGGPKWEDGRIVKAPMPTKFGYYMQAYQLNLRRPMFKDARVREAFSYTYDFDRVNRAKTFTRCDSMFNNSPFAAEGLPGPGELALLEPFRAELPPRVFGPAFKAPRFDGGPESVRKNLLKARELLIEAGWKVGDDGWLRNDKGERLVIEYMEARTSDRVDWIQNCRKVGIELKQRVVDFALFRRRLEQYDFDMVTIVEGRFTLPQGSDLTAGYGSKAADEQGNSNYRGVKSKAVDALLDALVKAETLQQLRDAARALDRVVMWNFWQLPDLYQGTEQVSHWNRFGKPAKMADYFQADTLISGFGEHGPWPLWTWWDKSLDKTALDKTAAKA